jgi:hypothetical protein
MAYNAVRRVVMRHVFAFALMLSLGAGLAGCGKSEEERKAEEAQQAAEDAAEEMARGFEGLAKAMEGLAAGAAAPDGKPVDPVSFRDLEAALPQMPGWEQEKPRGERMTSPIPFSQTETSYANGDARVDVKIVDSGFNQMLIAPWAMFLAAGYERETSEGFERSVQVDGHSGFERWESEGRQGELNVVVARRFLVTLEGRDIDDPAVLHAFMRRVDTAKLETLK